MRPIGDSGGSGTPTYSPATELARQQARPKSSSKKSIGHAKVTQKKSRSSRGGGYSRSSGGGSSGGFSSRGGGSGGFGAAPSVSSYLSGDSVYQQAIRGGKRSLADFISEIGRRRGEAGTQFNQTKSSMERDRVQQLEDLRNEFASRGLIQSGIYGGEQGKFQQKFTEQQTALSQQQAALLADLLSQEKNYRRENDLALEAAKQEALMRRAQNL